jgi:hypothetical protein
MEVETSSVTEALVVRICPFSVKHLLYVVWIAFDTRRWRWG